MEWDDALKSENSQEWDKSPKWNNSLPPQPKVILYVRKPAVTWVGLKPAEAGLTNLGNTCFVNASLQALVHLPGFVEFLQDDSGHRSKCFSLLDCVECALYRTYLNMSLHPIFKPTGLINLLPRIHNTFKEGKQADAHEFLTFLLSLIEDRLMARFPSKLDFCSKQTSAIGKIFGWWTETHDSCIDCEKTKVTYDPVSIIALPLMVEREQEAGSLRSIDSVQDAVNHYMGGLETLKCTCTPKCESKKAIRSVAFHSYPSVLRIMFNRFDNSGHKIMLPVSIDKTLNVGKAVYKFVSGIIHHEGLTVMEGHYTCLAVRSDGKLMHYNDAVVSDGDPFFNSTVTKCGIYIVLYQLHHFKPESLKRSPPNTPSKATSPLHKKQHVSSLKKSLEKKTKGKMMTFSPKKFKRKLGDFVKFILPYKSCKPSSSCDIDKLAKPLVGVTDEAPDGRITYQDLASESTVTAVVSPIKIPMKLISQTRPNILAQRRRSLVFPSDATKEPSHFSPKKSIATSSPESSEEGRVTPSAPSEATFDALITPVKITRYARTEPKLTASQSSHEYMLRHDSDMVHSESSPNQPIPPIRISWKPRQGPKSSDSQSNNEYVIQPRPSSREKEHSTDCCQQTNRTMDGLDFPPENIDKSPDSHVSNWMIDGLESPPENMNNSHDSIGLKRMMDGLELESPQGNIDSTEKPITLTPDDVPGGRLPKKAIHKNRASQLERWLLVRGITKEKKDKKIDLVKKVEECIKKGMDNVIDPSVDDGRWYKAKQQKLKEPLLENDDSELLNKIIDGLKPPAEKIKPVTLTADDIPGGHLPHKIIARNTKPKLIRWLEIRGIPHGGAKKDLVKKVQDCIDSGNSNTIDPKVDCGWWYESKRQQLQPSQNYARLKTEDLFPLYGWSQFPSRDIPINFNFGSVYHYLIETMPEMEDIIHVSDDASSGDEEVEEVIKISDPFLDAECHAIKLSKKLRRGLQYVKSDYVQKVQDTLPDRVHVYKGTVKASMRDKKYKVMVALSQVSGSVIRCTCDIICPQKSLGRCSHVSAMLLYILIFKNLNGPQAITCTSRPNTWNKGSSKHAPEVAKKRQYDSFKINVVRRATFDPRPTEFQSDFPPRSQISDFWCNLSSREKPPLFLDILSLKYEEFDFDDEDKAIFRDRREEFYEALQHQIQQKKPSPYYQGAFEVKDTTSQSSSEEWLKIRAIHCSAQPSRQIAHFQKDSARMNFLRKHLWGLDKITTKAMAFGKKNEAVAREDYAREEIEVDPTVVVEQCGLCLNTNFPGLSCSPDGIKISAFTSDTLVEIKCLYSMKNQDPNKFDELLPKKKLSNFCLQREENGDIVLKSNHAYYDQVQFLMGFLGLIKCDFVVWTTVNFLTVHVPFDADRWHDLKEKLTLFHRNYLVPEYFAMKTPRKLKPECVD